MGLAVNRKVFNAFPLIENIKFGGSCQGKWGSYPEEVTSAGLGKISGKSQELRLRAWRQSFSQVTSLPHPYFGFSGIFIMKFFHRVSSFFSPKGNLLLPIHQI